MILTVLAGGVVVCIGVSKTVLPTITCPVLMLWLRVHTHVLTRLSTTVLSTYEVSQLPTILFLPLVIYRSRRLQPVYRVIIDSSMVVWYRFKTRLRFAK